MRLRTMSAAEVAVRARRRVMLEAWRRRRVWSSPVFTAVPSAGSYVPPALDDEPGVAEAIAQADCQLAGGVDLLGQTFSTLGTDWHLDPQSGVRSPLDFGPLFDYRDGGVGGNTRNVWELNRHQHLVPVALAFAATREQRYAAYVQEQIEAWLRQDPFPLGVNWSSALELGLRLISWVWIGRFLSGSAAGDDLFGTDGRLWDSVYRHQWAIERLYSIGSSANNHLIGEMTGLFIAASEWPFFLESRGWARRAYRVLDAEIARQYYPSGLNREQAFAYHLFATELLLLAAVEGERLGRPFSPAFLGTLTRAAEAAAALAGPGSLQPAYGDGDDGVAVGLPGGSDGLCRLQAVAAWWLGVRRGVAACEDRACATGARLLLSGIRLASDGAVAAPEEPSAPRVDGAPPAEAASTFGFGDAGLFRLVSHEDGMEVVCLADAGELGYLSIAAHGHADCLSFTLTADDEQLLVDPGTYTYHYDLDARAYFRGTAAHNTVLVDDEDQSEPAGPFLWSRKARPTVHCWEPRENGGLLVASHDGYSRLRQPVRHERSLLLDGRTAVIKDILEGDGLHHVEWRLHAAPHCQVRLYGGACELTGRSHRLMLELDETLAWELLTAQGRGGWYSCCFNRREPTTTLVGGATLRLPARLRHSVTVTR